MKIQHLMMKNIYRSIRFPLPVLAVGSIPHSPVQKAKNRYLDKIEYCIRLSSEEDYAIDSFDGKVSKLAFPHVMVKPPDVVHCYETRRSRCAFYFMYRKETIPELVRCGIPVEGEGWEITLTPSVTRLIHKITKLFRISQNPGAAEQIDLLCFQLLEEVTLMRRGLHAENEQEKKIRAIASYLQIHFREKISIENLIRANGFSRRSFFRCWKRYFKVTPLQHILDLRLNEAERLLQQTDRSVEEIAGELCFTDAAYLIRLFRRSRGFTPFQCRKRSGIT